MPSPTSVEAQSRFGELHLTQTYPWRAISNLPPAAFLVGAR